MSIESLLNQVNRYFLNPIIILLFAVALLVFFWGIFRFIYGIGDQGGKSDGRAEGKRAMAWGLVGMFIMFSAYGLIRFILNTFDIHLTNNYPGF